MPVTIPTAGTRKRLGCVLPLLCGRHPPEFLQDHASCISLTIPLWLCRTSGLRRKNRARKSWYPVSYINPTPTLLRSAYLVGPGFVGKESLRSILRERFKREDLESDKLVAPEINSFRAELGLKSVEGVWFLWGHSRQRVIGLWPEWFSGPQSDWPQQAVVTGSKP